MALAMLVLKLTVVHQPSVTIHGLVVSKSCISRKSFNIPRLEIASADIASNSIENTKAALKSCNIRSIAGWTDSKSFALVEQTRNLQKVHST